MRKILSTLILLSFSLFLNGQNLTLAQILEIKKKDLGNAEEFLTERGWEFMEANEPTDETLGSATFTYNKSEISSSAESFLKFMYSNYSDKTRIAIQVNKKSKYNEYMAAIKSYGCKLISSKVDNGNIVKVYRGATTTFEVRSSTSENFYNQETAIWMILIISNLDYELNFVEE